MRLEQRRRLERGRRLQRGDEGGLLRRQQFRGLLRE
jgi:hypothetical protein